MCLLNIFLRGLVVRQERLAAFVAFLTQGCLLHKILRFNAYLLIGTPDTPERGNTTLDIHLLNRLSLNP
jgi:hypothetical protein